MENGSGDESGQRSKIKEFLAPVIYLESRISAIIIGRLYVMHEQSRLENIIDVNHTHSTPYAVTLKLPR